MEKNLKYFKVHIQITTTSAKNITVCTAVVKNKSVNESMDVKDGFD